MKANIIMIRIIPLLLAATLAFNSMGQDQPEQRHLDANAVLERAIKLGLDQKDRSLATWNLCRQLASRRYPQPEHVSSLQRLIELEERRNRFKPIEPFAAFRPAPTKEDGICDGNFSVYRTLETGISVGQFFAEMSRGTIVFGITGTGKSTGAYQTARNYITKAISTFICAKKPDQFFYPLAQEYPGKVLIAEAGKTKNLYSPWCSPISRDSSSDRVGIHLPIFANIYERFDSTALIVAAVDHFDRFLRTDAKPGPSISDLIAIIPQLQASQGYKFSTTLKNSIHTVLLQIAKSPLGVSIDCNRGWNLTEILKNGISIIIDTSRLGPRDEEYLITSIARELRLIIQTSDVVQSVHGAKALVIVDEASLLLKKKWWYQISPFVFECTQGRSAELHLYLCCHSPGSIEPLVWSNTNTTVIANLSSSIDVEVGAKSTGLIDEQKDAITHLPVGVAILKRASRYTHPFLVTWDPLPSFPHMTEAQIEANNVEVFKNCPWILPPATATPAELQSSEDPTIDRDDHDIERAILVDLHRRPFIGVAERFKKPSCPIKMSWRDGRKLLEDLEKRGLCESIKFQIGKRGAPQDLFCLTKQGYEELDLVDKPVSTRPGTGYLHATIQRWIVGQLTSKAVAAQLEDTLDDSKSKRVDVGVRDPKNGLRIAIEVCLTTSRSEPEQATKNLDAGWDRVLILCPNISVLRLCENAFKAEPCFKFYSNVTICLPRDIAQNELKELVNSRGLVFKKDRK
jgi:hypothetical protein